MKDCIKPLREGLYAALNGIISVPVTDGLGSGNCVIIEGISEAPINTLDSFRTNVIVDFDIVTRQYNGYSRDAADGIADEILQVLIPSVDVAGFSVSGFQAGNVQKVSGNYIDEPGEEENIVRKILRIQTTLIQN